MKRAIQLATLLLCLCLWACADMRPIQDPDKMIDDFASGRVELAGLSTTGNFVKNRQGMVSLYRAGDWSSLAKLVIQINHDHQLTWFYLGSAAEGLGFYAAAKTYYYKAATTIYKCTGPLLSNDCDGWSFPADAEDGIRRVNQDLAKGK